MFDICLLHWVKKKVATHILPWLLPLGQSILQDNTQHFCQVSASGTEMLKSDAEYKK